MFRCSIFALKLTAVTVPNDLQYRPADPEKELSSRMQRAEGGRCQARTISDLSAGGERDASKEVFLERTFAQPCRGGCADTLVPIVCTGRSQIPRRLFLRQCAGGLDRRPHYNSSDEMVF